VEQKIGRRVSDVELASHLMYPEVFADYAKHRRTYGVVSVVPTSTYFYGMTRGQEISVDIDRGKALVIRYLALGEPDEEGRRNVFFELNGQPRTVKVADHNAAATGIRHPKAEDGNPNHVAAPMPGLIVSIAVAEGQEVARGDVLVAIEAMKMETAVTADRDGVVDSVVQAVGAQVDAKDLLVVLKSED
jgi:pyruvate carboxylase